MATYKVSIVINAETPEMAKKVGGLLQTTINKVDQKDLVSLMQKVVQSPKIVKKALNFI